MAIVIPVKGLRVVCFVNNTSSTIRAKFRLRRPDLLSSILALGFFCILFLLVSLERSFTVFFSLSNLLVFGLELEIGVLLLHGSFIFKHTTHASNSISLLSISLLFLTISVSRFTSLAFLLLNPFFLSLHILLHAASIV